MTEIFRGLWIGDISYKNEKFIKNNKIDKVLNCATNFETDEILEDNYKYLQLKFCIVHD